MLFLTTTSKLLYVIYVIPNNNQQITRLLQNGSIKLFVLYSVCFLCRSTVFYRYSDKGYPQHNRGIVF